MREKQPLHYRCASTRRNFKHRLNQACPSVFTAASRVSRDPDFYRRRVPTGALRRLATPALSGRKRHESTFFGYKLPLHASYADAKSSLAAHVAAEHRRTSPHALSKQARLKKALLA